ncbi:MAG: class II aldolase/adducin family protein [Lentisphaerae bacterium]|jgi:hypothetical protein|nr:class II aldolase/adducin family protein [Lentisphaerota bacterium]
MPSTEGYIKFTCRHEPAPPPRHPWLPQLCRIRDELRNWQLIGLLPDGIGYGNISARIGDTSRFVITASGTGGEYPIATRHFCEVLSVDIPQNTVTCRGPLPASSESMSHAAVYAARRDTRAVFHIHDRPMFDLLRATGAPQTPPDAAYGTPELARAIGSLASALPAVAMLVMGGHPDGLLAYAPEPRKARDLLWNTYLRSRHAHA